MMKFLRRFSRRVRVSDDRRATPPAPVESAPARAMQRVRIENRANKAGRRRSRLSVIGLVLSVGFVISAGRAVQIAAFGALLCTTGNNRLFHRFLFWPAGREAFQEVRH